MGRWGDGEIERLLEIGNRKRINKQPVTSNKLLLLLFDIY
jgi:hypothetical protein